MKKYFLLILAATSLITAAFVPFGGGKDGYSIRIKVAGIKDTLCQLAYYYGDNKYLKDSAKVNASGEMIFKGKDSLPGGIYLLVLPDKKYFEFIVNEQNFSLETDTGDFVNHMKVKGSQENELFYNYLKYINPKGRTVDSLRKETNKVKEKGDTASVRKLKEQISAIDKDVNDYKTKFMKEHPANFMAKVFKAMVDPEIPEPPKRADGSIDSSFRYYYYKEHYFDNIDMSDDRMLRSPVFHGKLKNYMESVVPQHPDSIALAADFVVEKTRKNKEMFKYVVITLTNLYGSSNIMGQDAIFVHMVDNYYNTGQAYWVDSVQKYKITDRARTLKPILLGKKAPPLYLSDSSGKFHALYDVKAKYTVLCFWDPDCGHCKKEIPKLDSLYKIIHPKGVEVFAVCTEVEMDKWKQYIAEHKLTWINVADPQLRTNFRQLYDIYSTPVIYLLNDKKEIIAKRIDVPQLGGFLDRLFKEAEEKK